MSQFVLLILICSASLDHSACHRDNAVDSIQVPVASELECNGTRAQTVVAANGAPLAPRPGKEYMLMVCQRQIADQ